LHPLPCPILPPSCSETSLADGRVLLAGGPGPDWAAAELFDPAVGGVRPTDPMISGRASHAAVLLGDGRVLLAGGVDDRGLALVSAEVFDPATGRFSAIGGLNQPRVNASATLLANGEVLIAGGEPGRGDGCRCLNTAEIFEPATGQFRLVVGRMVYARRGHAAVRLVNGMVLLAGGQEQPTQMAAEIFDPATGRFTVTGTPSLQPPQQFTLTRLADGRVLLDGDLSQTLVDAEIYDPSTGVFTTAWCPLSSTPMGVEQPGASPRSVGRHPNGRRRRNAREAQAGAFAAMPCAGANFEGSEH
jgi:Galactose oxidase, central domain